MAVDPLTDVFFWALLATATLFVEVVVFTSRRQFARRTYAMAGILAILGFGAPRAIIPFLPQPSMGLPGTVAVALGGLIFVLGVGIILLSIRQLRKGSQSTPDGEDSPRRPVLSDGVYGLVRHPMYLGDVLWSLGLAIGFKAAYAVQLKPNWWGLRAELSVLEEERLIDKHGEAYRAYRDRVPDRIVPLRF